MEDATFHFEDPASPQAISDLEKKLGVTFPNDYKEFLLQHNGMKMFDGVEILNIEGIIEYNEVQDFPEGYVLIGYHFDGRYVIDTSKSRNGLGYMLYLDSIDAIEDAVNLDSNFEIWFDMLVSSNGTKYWEVSPNIQEYYKLVSE
ncbi:SMI1/KNR4 family protein [Bacillus paralicheniformis]|uniref:SMI1/KNR4 family protein n=1 Tax=Bacillus TaxID=1386 RepID=UPI000E4528E9|nr:MULTISPECIES: SMI1/KNR4 family protein [Bacillus]MCU4668674.1 SMI1/KNR4 family protein [Bacillus paralicheniformis]MED1234260.1 SMI1/KNR4 family protein [Bacillus paralicheniformis]UWS64228.1 SMI1/KNR4 family protein [Bacillus paralicheniformis]WEZ26496.1 SMI1/KNR4 family protein [Bacillus paralicheniformis]